MPLSWNQVQLVGRAGHDPELFFLTDGTPVTRLRIYVAAEPDRREAGPEAFQLVAWGSTAEALCARVSRGQAIFVQGRLSNRSFRREGITHLRTEIHLTAFHHLASVASAQESPLAASPICHE